ncbi:ATP-dependent nuclease [Clostridium perfringens]|uniref:ATP-dependent nuclease n=1 Tax=Clostridium perfringens TaxID=1502 RepID=UPI001CCD4397|nr:AAA family ATPase [Clostridium perfringens]UBK55830.1 AAA family ATPase [Clostridium perfringens]
MKLSKLRIKNYKSFKDSGTIEIKGNIFALIGQNNAGKSAIMDAIQVFFPNCKKSANSENFHKFTKEDISIELWFSKVNSDYLENKLFQDKIKKQNEVIKKCIETEKYDKELKKLDEIREKELNKCILKYGIENEELYVKKIIPKESKAFYILKNNDKISEADLKKILPELKIIPAIRDPKNESTAGTNSYLKDLIQMLDEEAQTEIMMEDKKLTYKELNEVLSEETSKRSKELSSKITNYYSKAIGSSDFEVKVNSSVNISKGTNYSTELIDNTTNIKADILDCGTGYQSMVILALLETYVEIAHTNNNYILIIEEPEVYLHPRLQRKMIDTLLRVSEHNQVIFTTHSPITISKLNSLDVKLVERELLKKLDKCIIDKINIIQAVGCSNFKWYANAEILINKNFDIPTLILRDSDVERPEKLKKDLVEDIINSFINTPQYARYNQDEKEEIKTKINDAIKVLSQHSLEYYFINPNLLVQFYECKVELENAIKCYNCKYNDKMQEGLSGKDIEGKVQNYYQPKRFLEGYPDKPSDIAKNLEPKFIEEWESYKESCNCEISELYGIDNFIKIRNVLKNNINDFNKSNDVFKEIINMYDIKYLEENGLKELIDILKEFIIKVKI